MNRVSRNATQLSLRHAGRRCGPTSSANNFCQCVTGFTSPIIRFTVLGVERWWLHEWSAHERVGGRMKSKFFILFSSTFWARLAAVTRSHPATAVSYTDSFPTPCRVSAPVPLWAAVIQLLNLPSALPTQCAGCRLWTTPWPSLIPLRYNAYTLYRVALKAQSFSESLPTHCQLNAPVAVKAPVLRFVWSGTLPTQCPGCPVAPVPSLLSFQRIAFSIRWLAVTGTHVRFLLATDVSVASVNSDTLPLNRCITIGCHCNNKNNTVTSS